MNRTAISKTQNIISSGEYFVDGLMLSNQKVSIEIEVNSNCDILLNNFKDILELNININEDSNVTLSFLSESEMKESNININVKHNASLISYFADFHDWEAEGIVTQINRDYRFFRISRIGSNSEEKISFDDLYDIRVIG